MSGLAFLGVFAGVIWAIVTEPLARRLINSHKFDPETRRVPPEAMVSVICIAAVLTPVGELWFAWSCAPKTIHWIWPILSGIPFGVGNTLNNIYSSNYLAQSYSIYAASALASNAVCRSVLGATMPLAGISMYAALGPNWAATLLGLIMVVLIPIPCAFYKFGHKIRLRSTVIKSMQQELAALSGKKYIVREDHGVPLGSG